jgi:hypothetical protein
MKQKEYLIECPSCEQDTRIISCEEPSFCPICMQNAAPIVVYEEEDEDDDI